MSSSIARDSLITVFKNLWTNDKVGTDFTIESEDGDIRYNVHTSVLALR